MSWLKVVLLLSLASLSVPAFCADTARPGTINYVEGSAMLAGQPITPRAVGSAELEPGQILTTGQGKAEVLLTPGVFLRVGDNSAVRMVSTDLTYTAVDLERGRALVEVDAVFPQNDLQVQVGGVATQLLKTGLYDFNADRHTVSVFDGKAAVREDDQRWVVVKGHRELALAADSTAKPVKLDVNNKQDDLYKWSSLRSEYLSQANAQIAGQYIGVAGFAPGWYWDPYLWNYTFVGLGPLWSPFGWGFYPPWYYAGGYYGYGWGRGYAGRAYAGGGWHAGLAGGFHGGGGGRR
jgi:hypothetical protein